MAKEFRSRRRIRDGVRYTEYNTIDTVNNGTIKVIEAKSTGGNSGVPIFSNSANTTYMLTKDVNGKKQITSIAIYRKGKIVQNIDLDVVQGAHYHKWVGITKKGKIKRKKLPNHYANLNRKQLKLVKIAQEWNGK